jgi:hypothetical protein
VWDVYIYLHSTFECDAKLGETTVALLKAASHCRGHVLPKSDPCVSFTAVSFVSVGTNLKIIPVILRGDGVLLLVVRNRSSLSRVKVCKPRASFLSQWKCTFREHISVTSDKHLLLFRRFSLQKTTVSLFVSARRQGSGRLIPDGFS